MLVALLVIGTVCACVIAHRFVPEPPTHKARISRTTRKVLRDPVGREQLLSALAQGEGPTTITCSDGTSYVLRRSRYQGPAD
jgi:hypothetical protein